MSHIFDLRNDDHFFQYSLDNVDCQYMDLVNAILTEGTKEADPKRSEDTWTMLPSISMTLRNTAMAFPVLLSKRTRYVPAIDETCWFMRGETNIETLNSRIWDEWADESGDCGPIYGYMWRHWPDVKAFQDFTKPSAVCPSADAIRIRNEIIRMRAAGYKETQLADGRILFEGEIDQLLNALNACVAHDRSRRIKVEAWNPGYIHMQGLPPCHTGFEFNVTKTTDYERKAMEAMGHTAYDDSLHLTATMRSQDVALGRSFNIIGYTTMLHLFAKYSKLNIGSFTLNTSNTHVYDHHREGLETQRKQFQEILDVVRSTGKPMQYPVLHVHDDIMKMEPKEMLDSITKDHFLVEGYLSMPEIKFRVTK